MIREVTVAMAPDVEIISGNTIRRMHWRVAHKRATKQRCLVATMILDSFARRPFRVFLPDGRPNEFRVTITRITIRGSGFDAHDRLRAGCEAIVDALSAVIMRGQAALLALNDPTGKAWKSMAGRDDGRKCFEWMYDQQRSTDLVGMRIRIEDLEEGDPIIVYKDPPKLLGQASASRPTKPVPLATNQQALLFRRAWIALPWLQSAADPDELVNLAEADTVSRMMNAPEHIDVKSPAGAVVRLYRHDHTDPALGGKVWLYCTIVPADVTAGAHQRRSA